MESSKIYTITPNKAKELLEKNTINRPVNQKNVDFIARQIMGRTFHLTGESIKISKSGNLLDGQHRLLAIIQCGVAAKMFITEGLEDECFKYIDTGRPRQASDVLAIEGVLNATKIAAITKFIINFKRGYYSNAAEKNSSSGIKKISNSEVSEFVSKNEKELVDSYEFGFGKGKRLIQGTLISSLHYIFKQINEKDADIFINKVTEGENIGKTNPIFLLREKFIFEQRSKRKMRMVEKVALICKTWNLIRDNKTVVRLEWDSNRENFPKPR